MAAAARKPELKDFQQEGDNQGAVQNFQDRYSRYQEALRDWEGSQKSQPANSNKPAQAIKTSPKAPAKAVGPAPTNTSSVPAGGTPAAAGAAAAAAAAAAAPVPGGFNLKTNVKRDSANESKGEFGSAQFEAKFNKIANRMVATYNEQMPLLRNYDQMVQTQIDKLIGDTVPQVQEMFRQSGEQYGFAKDFYEQSKGYDTESRREQERGKAMTDVRMAGEASRNQAIETLESFGVDPSQARGAALDQNLRLQTALAQAQAGSEAELGVEERGREYTAQGLGVLNEAARTTQGATTAGANILEGNVKAQLAGKAGAIETGQQGIGMLEAASRQIQSSASARQAKAASIAARQAAKGDGGTAAAIGGVSSLIGTGLGLYLSGGNPAGATAGNQIGAQTGGYAGQWAAGS